MDCTLLFCSLPNERKRLWVKFRFLPSSRWTDVILQNYTAKRMRIYALTAAILTKYGKTRFTISRRLLHLHAGRMAERQYKHLLSCRSHSRQFGLYQRTAAYAGGGWIILYTVPFISGTGRHFFKSALPEARWTLSSQKSYSNGVYRSIYTRMETMK